MFFDFHMDVLPAGRSYTFEYLIDDQQTRKIVKDRKIAGYYSMKDDLINAGANYTDEPAVIDGNIITTAHYKDMGPWMKEALKILYKN